MAANDRRIFVGDLPPQVRISDIHHFFKNCGKIWDVYLDKNNSRYAFVQFDRVDDARQAVRRLNGEKLLGVRIRVQMTKTIRKRKQKRNNNERKRGERSPPGDERDNTNIDDDYEESYVEHYENIDQQQKEYDEGPSDYMQPSMVHIPVPVQVPISQPYIIREERPLDYYPADGVMMMPQVYHHSIDYSYPIGDTDERLQSAMDSMRYNNDRHSQPESPCPPSPLPPSQTGRQQSHERKVSSVNKRKRSEEPEIYDVSKETKETQSLSRWLAYCKGLAERLDKMSEKQQAYARMKIEEAMYQAEFGPYPIGGTSSHAQPAGSCTGTLYPVGFLQQP